MKWSLASPTRCSATASSRRRLGVRHGGGSTPLAGDVSHSGCATNYSLCSATRRGGATLRRAALNASLLTYARVTTLDGAGMRASTRGIPSRGRGWNTSAVRCVVQTSRRRARACARWARDGAAAGGADAVADAGAAAAAAAGVASDSVTGPSVGATALGQLAAAHEAALAGGAGLHDAVGANVSDGDCLCRWRSGTRRRRARRWRRSSAFLDEGASSPPPSQSGSRSTKAVGGHARPSAARLRRRRT